MKRQLTRIVIALVLLALPACAQRQDTVFQTLVTNATINGVTPVVRNIGQGQHRATVRMASTPLNVCDTTTNDFVWQVSYDGINFSVAGHPTTAGAFGNLITANPTFTMKLDGAYPYVRISYTFDTVTCTVASMDYSGTLYPASDDTTIAQSTPLVGLVPIPINIAASTTLFAGTSASYRVCVYSMTLIPDAPVTVTISTPAAGDASGPMDIGVNGTVLGALVLPGSSTPHFCTPGRGLRLTLGAAIQVSGFAMIREEFLPSAF